MVADRALTRETEIRAGWETVSQCPVCNSQPGEHQAFENLETKVGVLRYLICSTCGLVFQSPRMSETSLDEFYQAAYRNLVQGVEGPTPKDLGVQRARAGYLLGQARRLGLVVHRHLDLGSSTGALLEAFIKAHGCVGVGVEPGGAYRDWSSSRGIETFADLDDLPESYSGSFDLVSGIHVLEHLPDPVQALEGIRKKWLAQGGRLLLEVPNLFGHRSVEVAHLFAFSRQTLGEALRAAGFEVETAWIHGEPRSRILPLYLDVVARAARPEAAREIGGFGLTSIRVRRTLAMWALDGLTRFLLRLTWKGIPAMKEDALP